MDPHHGLTGTALIGTPRDTRAARRIDSDAYRIMFMACMVPPVLFRLSPRYAYLCWVGMAVGAIVCFTILATDDRKNRRVQRCTITPELSRLLTLETQAMAAERPDAGLLALVRAAITHPAHHTAEAADALTACATLVDTTHDTPMQATTTATLESLTAQAMQSDPAMWPAVQGAATQQVRKVQYWHTAEARTTAAIETPTRQAQHQARPGRS